MKNKSRILSKIEKIEKLLSELKKDISEFETSNIKSRAKKNKKEETPNSEELKKEYDKLYKDFLDRNSEIVSSFISTKSIAYIKEFCRVNSISIDSQKQSKTKIADEIIRWFQQRKAISKRNK